MKIRVSIEMEFKDVPGDRAALVGHAVYSAAAALGNVTPRDAEEGVVLGDEDKPCGTWKVTDLPEPKKPAELGGP